jgi:hypothetical protein
MKARPVAWAIPGAFGSVPAHQAAQVRTHRRNEPDLALGIARAGHALTVQIQDFPLVVFRWLILWTSFCVCAAESPCTRAKRQGCHQLPLAMQLARELMKAAS